MSKKIVLGLLLLTAFNFLAACGQSGPLYLPTDRAAAKKLAPK